MLGQLGKQALLRDLLLQERFGPIEGSEQTWMPIGVGGTSLRDRSEVYRAKNVRTGEHNIIKVKVNGDEGEIDRLQPIAAWHPAFSIPTGVFRSSVSFDKQEQPVIIMVRGYQEKATMRTARHVESKPLRRSGIQLASGLVVLEKERVSMVDINPSNVLLHEDGRDGQFMDGDASQRYADDTIIEKIVEDFTHQEYENGRPIDPGLDAFNLLASLAWVTQNHRLQLEDPWREVARLYRQLLESENTLDSGRELLEVLEKPDVIRRRNTRVLAYLAIGLVAVGANELSIRQAHQAIEQTPQHIIGEMGTLGGEALGKRILDMRARDVLTLIKQNRYPITGTRLEDAVTSLPLTYGNTGSANGAGMQYTANTFIETLGALSQSDTTLDPYFQSLAYSHLLQVTGRPTDHALGGGKDVRGFWMAYERSSNPDYLDEILARTDEEISRERITNDGHTVYTYLAPTERFMRAEDARIMRTIITGIDAAHARGDQERASRYRDAAERFANTLEQFIEDNKVHERIIINETEVRVDGAPYTIGQAEIALAFAEFGARTHNASLMERSKALLEPFLDMNIARIGLEPQAIAPALQKLHLDSQATAYRAARVLQAAGYATDTFTAPLLRKVAMHMTSHEIRMPFDDGFDYRRPHELVQTDPSQPTLFEGGLSCIDPRTVLNAEVYCRINSPFAEKEIIVGIAAPLPKIYYNLSQGSSPGTGGGQGGWSGPPHSQGLSANTAGAPTTTIALPIAKTINPIINTATTLFMISPQDTLEIQPYQTHAGIGITNNSEVSENVK